MVGSLGHDSPSWPLLANASKYVYALLYRQYYFTSLHKQWFALLPRKYFTSLCRQYFTLDMTFKQILNERTCWILMNLLWISYTLFWCCDWAYLIIVAAMWLPEKAWTIRNARRDPVLCHRTQPHQMIPQVFSNRVPVLPSKELVLWSSQLSFQFQRELTAREREIPRVRTTKEMGRKIVKIDKTPASLGSY